ncbi:MAG: hypothetical protein KKB31_02455 [Nanoarchaeota archaeon]|nr:hypothetical protein [Nanoarchaeota archaeon]
MGRKLAIIVETFQSAGRYQHKVFEEGAVRKEVERREISTEVVDMLKKVNERLYDEMPEGSEKLVSRIEYTLPK